MAKPKNPELMAALAGVIQRLLFDNNHDDVQFVLYVLEEKDQTHMMSVTNVPPQRVETREAYRSLLLNIKELIKDELQEEYGDDKPPRVH